MIECMGWDGSMVAHGGLSPVCSGILQDQAGVRAPNETRVSRGRADPHENSGLRTQTRSAAVLIGAQAIEIETQVTEAVGDVIV